MARSRLLTALDRHKGRDIRLEKQRKKEKEARKRKQSKQAGKEDEEDEAAGGVALDVDEVEKVNGTSGKKGKKVNGAKPNAEEVDWETDEDEDEEELSDDEDDMPERPVFDMSRLEDSDSEGSSDDDAEEEEEDAEEDEEAEDNDIALSDIESLASEDKGPDLITHQRLTINNTTALTAALERIRLPISKMPFSEHLSMTTDEPVDIPDADDDLNRELAFYKQSLSAVKDARVLLKKEGQPFSRPADYFAEMVKSDEHMGKIKAKLVDEAAGKKAAAEARRQRDLKKFGKQVQVAKLQARAKEKRDTLEKINILKRKRQGADLTSTNEEDLFDVELDKAEKSAKDDRRRGDGPNHKRQKKDSKYGFGGKKRFAKSGDAVSSADMSGFSMKRMREDRPGKGKMGGASKRLGKSRRAKRN